jgi:hypothetical protein
VSTCWNDRAVFWVCAGLKIGRTVDSNHRRIAWGAKAATVILVHHGAPGEDPYSLRCGYGNRQLFPMHPVGANGMPPGDRGSPRCPEWVVLVKHMVLALIIHEPVGIVDPVDCGRVMELRAIRLLIGRDALSKGTLAESQGQYGCRSQNIGPLRQRLSPPLGGERTDLLFHVFGVLSGEARGLA